MNPPNPTPHARSGPQRPPSPPTRANRWLPAIASLAVLAVVIGAGAFGGDDGGPRVAADGAGSDQTLGGATSTTVTTASEESGYGVTGLTVPESTLVPVMTET